MGVIIFDNAFLTSKNVLSVLPTWKHSYNKFET